MTASRLLIFSLFLALIFTQIRADVSTEPLIESDDAGSSALKAELDQLKSKIRLLESNVEEKIRELKTKDGKIKEKDKIIKAKSHGIASLQTELSSLQKKGTSDADEQVRKAHAQALELQKQVDKLKTELEAKLKEADSLEARVNKAENKLNELSLKLENLENINKEQVNKIAKTERALKIAEEELIKTKLEATSKGNELMEVHRAWLPPWLAMQLNHGQAFIRTHWTERGKPAMDMVVQKKWVPAIKDQWVVVTAHAEPHVRSLKTKTVEVYEASKTAVTPHVVKVQEIVDPYFQETKKFSKPYIDQVVNAYGTFLESATTYHQQVQASVQETLKKHELTRPLATKELEWFAICILASALLALPITILFRIFSTVFCKKEKKHARHAHTTHGRRKGKRGHTDK
ncbi:uncharacterized protein LOC120193809 isoform X3 [Hibiscus syriacus]|uniref:uncharacterized protein LOC120193809 isoform X3 n=1 Tax=Hibiscus syriacus TaxID=106335 RepID=UPI001920D1CC|nr:uncharacterized protein LOC120193809 isoform X3 [Hibiscus syriacus]